MCYTAIDVSIQRVVKYYAAVHMSIADELAGDVYRGGLTLQKVYYRLQFVCDDALEHPRFFQNSLFISLWHACSFLDQIESFVLAHIHAKNLLFIIFSVAGNKITSLIKILSVLHASFMFLQQHGWRLEGCSQPCRGSF